MKKLLNTFAAGLILIANTSHANVLEQFQSVKSNNRTTLYSIDRIPRDGYNDASLAWNNFGAVRVGVFDSIEARFDYSSSISIKGLSADKSGIAVDISYTSQDLAHKTSNGGDTITVQAILQPTKCDGVQMGGLSAVDVNANLQEYVRRLAIITSPDIGSCSFEIHSTAVINQLQNGYTSIDFSKADEGLPEAEFSADGSVQIIAKNIMSPTYDGKRTIGHSRDGYNDARIEQGQVVSYRRSTPPPKVDQDKAKEFRKATAKFAALLNKYGVRFAPAFAIGEDRKSRFIEAFQKFIDSEEKNIAEQLATITALSADMGLREKMSAAILLNSAWMTIAAVEANADFKATISDMILEAKLNL